MNTIKILFVITLLVYACNLSACSNISAMLRSPASRTGATFMQALPNAEYPIDVALTGKAQLKDGVFEETVVPGSATKTRISLTGKQDTGDLNGD
ncbi:MAG: hypothetical protein HOC71_07490, partial [Candidatus Latescibacteria bacterium]|nr:hypothetical protein [Candidatus Latescibacterota bacterium]